MNEKQLIIFNLAVTALCTALVIAFLVKIC